MRPVTSSDEGVGAVVGRVRAHVHEVGRLAALRIQAARLGNQTLGHKVLYAWSNPASSYGPGKCH